MGGRGSLLVVFNLCERREKWMKTNKKIRERKREREREKTRRRKQQALNYKKNKKSKIIQRKRIKGFLQVIRITTQGTLKLVRSFPNKIIAAVSHLSSRNPLSFVSESIIYWDRQDNLEIFNYLHFFSFLS